MQIQQQKQLATKPISHLNIIKQNPQYDTITHKYFQQKKKRRVYDSQRAILLNQQMYLKKLQANLKNKVKKQNQTLQYTKSTHQRRVEQIEKKMKQQQQRRQLLQKLKQQTTLQKKRLQNRIKKANIKKMNQKIHASIEVKRKLKQENQNKQKKRYRNLEQNNEKVWQINQGRQRCRSKVQKLKQGKRNSLLNSYRILLNQQNQKSQRAYSDMQSLKQSIKYYQNKIKKRKQTLEEIQDKINLVKDIGSRSICNSRANTFSLKNSRISSKPTQIILHTTIKTSPQ